MPAFHTDRVSGLKRRIYAVTGGIQELVVRGKAALGNAIRHVHGPGPEEVRCAEDELVVLCLVRDGALWIDSYLEHYLDLGARHIFFLDNGSTDDTVERAAAHDRVSVFATDIFFGRWEIGLRKWMTRTFGQNRWSLTADVDELFVYPYHDRLGLRGFLRYLNRYDYRAVAAQMLDMFSDRPFSELESRPGDPLREIFRFYDLSGVEKRRDIYWIRNGQLEEHADIACTFGGIRRQVFGSDGLLQTKHPLLRADEEVGVYTHDGHFATGAPVADVSAALLHYKFLGTLRQQAEENLRLGQHSRGSRHYKGFHRVLTENPGLCLKRETARELESVDELVEAGFLSVSDDYRRWVEEEAGAA